MRVRYHSKYKINNNIYCFQTPVQSTINEHVHIYCFFLLFNYFLANNPQNYYWVKGFKKIVMFFVFTVMLFSTKFEPLYNVTSKAPHTFKECSPHIFKECSYTCFIQIQILGSSVKKGRIWDGFYCRNSKLLGIEQMLLTHFTFGRPPVSHA